MATILENVYTLSAHLEDAYDALEAKGATIPATKNATNLSATIETVPSGGGETPEAEWKDVNFIDYDGKNLYSYTTAEALALTELPPPTDRTSKGLQFQEWNYTLAQVKANANDTGKCTAGATYTTTDGKTHIKITIQDEYYSNIPLVFRQTVSGGVEVDWGDGSAEQTYSSTSQQTISHQYAPTSYPASYDITFKVNSGSLEFPTYIMGKSGTNTSSNPVTAWNNMIDEVNIGNNVTRIGQAAFNRCYSLTSITIPSSVTSIGSSAFYYCHSLASVTIPSSVTSILSSAFDNCHSLTQITIPSSVTSIQPTMFGNCQSLASITIPNSVTYIGSYALQNCHSLVSVTIPSSVTSIESDVFFFCYGLVKLDCSACTQIPTLGNIRALSDTNVNLKIIVPNTLYSQWKTATNWSTYADHIVMANPSMQFKATQANSTIKLTQVGNPNPVSLEYLTTGSWTPYTIGDTITLANVGDSVFFRATSGVNNKFGTDASNYHQFVMTGEIEPSNPIMFLCNQEASESYVAGREYLFYKLFSGCSALVKAPELPEYINTQYCYAYMLEGTGIDELPTMPQASLDNYCYKGMFKDCTSITTAYIENKPIATGCYDEMFKGCSSLSEITIEYAGSFGTTYFNDWVDGVAASGTFYYNGTDTTRGTSAIPTGWTVLQIPRPELCFTAREANSTVSMAKNGSAPGVTLDYSTDGVTWEPFEVGTTTVTLANVGDKMWVRATSTNTQIGSSNSTYNYFVMTGQIAASGNINSLLSKNGFDQISKAPTYAYVYLFKNCTSLIDATELSLTCTGMNDNSYGHMFESCSNLVGGPDIYVNPMTSSNMGMWSMEYMFAYCSSLNSVKLRATGSDWYTGATGTWMNAVPSTGTFYYNGTYTGRGTSAIPTGWTITTFTP